MQLLERGANRQVLEHGFGRLPQSSPLNERKSTPMSRKHALLHEGVQRGCGHSSDGTGSHAKRRPGLHSLAAC